MARWSMRSPFFLVVFLQSITPRVPTLCSYVAFFPSSWKDTRTRRVEMCLSKGSAGGPTQRQRFFKASPPSSFLPLQSSSSVFVPPHHGGDCCDLRSLFFFPTFFLFSAAPLVAFPFKAGKERAKGGVGDALRVILCIQGMKYRHSPVSR